MLRLHDTSSMCSGPAPFRQSMPPTTRMSTGAAWPKWELSLAEASGTTVPRSRSLAVVDAHCHIDLYQNPKAVVAQAEALAIRTIAVTNAPSVFTYTRDLTAGCRYVRPAAGLHPELVHSHGHELEL